MTHDRGTSSRLTASRAWPLVVGGLLLALGAAWLLLRGSPGSDDDPATAAPGQDGSTPTATSTPTSTPTATATPAPGSAVPDPATGTSPAGPAATVTDPPGPTGTVPAGTPRPRVRGDLEDRLRITDGVTVRVTGITEVRGEARGVGEVAGPALRLSVTVENATRRPLDLDLGLVTVYAGPAGTPAAALSGPGARPLPAVVPAGRSATGRFVYAVPEDERDDLRVEFAYSTKAARAVFEGSSDDV